jgi:hypothetical protein
LELSLNKLIELEEVFAPWLSSLLIKRPKVDEAIGVSNGNSPPVRVPSEAVKCSALLSLLVGNWRLSVLVEIPHLDETISVTACENRGMNRAPFDIIYILLRTLKGEERLFFILWRPELEEDRIRSEKYSLLALSSPWLALG